jgi:hypothetical protein
VKGECRNGALFSSFSPLTCLCPAAADISPCTCDYFNNALSKTKLTITCTDRSISDTRMAAIFDKIPPNSTVYKMMMDANLLTQVPQGLTKLINLAAVDLSSNVITTVKAGAFALTAPVEGISLDDNNITMIEPAAFPGTQNILLRFLLNYINLISCFRLRIGAASYSKFGADISISGNPLKKFDRLVFEPVIQGFIQAAATTNLFSARTASFILDISKIG